MKPRYSSFKCSHLELKLNKTGGRCVHSDEFHETCGSTLVSHWNKQIQSVCMCDIEQKQQDNKENIRDFPSLICPHESL